METPSYAAGMALNLIEQAREMLILEDNGEEAKALLLQALDVQNVVEHFKSSRDIRRGPTGLTQDEIANHRVFTTVLTRACALAWYMKDDALAASLYQRALAWANDPQCSSKEQCDEVIALWQKLHAPWWQKMFHSVGDFFFLFGKYEIQKNGVEFE